MDQSDPHDLLSRRGLFAAAAGALLLPAVRGAPPARPRRKPQKAVKYYMIGPGRTVGEKFALAKQLGFDGVELDSPSGLAAQEVLRARDASGIAIPGVVDSVHWQKPLGDPDPAVRAAGRQALATALRDCQRYGGTSVLLVPAVVDKRVFYADAWQRSQQEIRQALPLAQELQVRILIENVWNGFLLGPTELQRYVDELDSPWTGVHFDAGNLVRFGYPEQWVPILGSRIKKVDVKDFQRQTNSFDVPLGEGDTDWPAVVRELRKVGYDGWFTAEMKAGADEAWLADLAARMDRLLV